MEIVDSSGMVFDWNPDLRNFGSARDHFQFDVLRIEDASKSLRNLKGSIDFKLEDIDEKIEIKFNKIIESLLPAEVKIFLGLTQEEKEFFIQMKTSF